jgi:uncharacterized protein (DUF2384 family)
MSFSLTRFQGISVKMAKLKRRRTRQNHSTQNAQTKLAANQLLTLHESDRLFRFAHITAMAEAIFGDKSKTKQWLSKPKARFFWEKAHRRWSLQPLVHI